jgi:membrane protease YdiL (CAAX protease family)
MLFLRVPEAEHPGMLFLQDRGARMAEDFSGRRRIVWLGIGFEGGLGLLAWGVGWLVGQPPLERFHWDWRDAALGMLASLPLLGLFLICIRWPVGPLARIKEFSDEVIREWFAPCTLFDLGLISLLAGIGEEMLFRGVLQASFQQWIGIWWSLAATSLLFGLLHPITPAYVVLAALMGAYLGWLQIIMDNLLGVMITHALYDFLALTILLRVWKMR